MLSHFYNFSIKEIDSMSIWYIERFMENIGNLQSWLGGGESLKPISIIETLVDEQNLRKGVF